MANPQKEKGYTRIANELMDAFCRYFPGHANGQVILYVLRKTYGWNKKGDHISITQIAEATGLSRRTVIYCIQNLEAQNIITVNRTHEGGKTSINYIEFQKDYEKWAKEAKGEQYLKTLEQQRNKYNEQKVVQGIEEKGQILAPLKTIEVVQGIDVTSARKVDLLVQGIEEKGQILAPTKEIKTIQKKIQKTYNLPDWLDVEIWKAFEDMRKKIKAPLTGKAIEFIIKDLEQFKNNGDNPNEVLKQSIKNSWRGVFALKNNGGNGHGRMDGQNASRTQGQGSNGHKPEAGSTGIRIIE